MPGDPLNCGNKPMVFDEACLHIKNEAEVPVGIQYQNFECYKCSLEPFMNINNGDIKNKIVNTTYGTILEFLFNNVTHKGTYTFEQHGHYGINITKSEVSELYEIFPPDNANGPFYHLLSTLVICWTLWSIGSGVFKYTQFYARSFQGRLIVNEAENDLGAIPGSRNSSPLIPETRDIVVRRRIESLDVFRGLTMSLMLFVNYGGGKYWFFQHSSWNGVTIADLIFPWFAWIMGASLLLSISSQMRNSIPRKKIFLKVFLRSLALFAIGIMLNSFQNNNVVTLRYPGVLQRLALAYLIVGSIEVALISSQNRYNITGRLKKVEDWIYGWAQWLIMISFIGLYCILTFSLPVPGCPTGYLGPGGLHQNSSFLNCTGGSAGYIDRLIFDNKHLYNGITVSSVYQNKLPFDPEGLLGTLTTAFTVYLGVHAGRIILCYTSPKGRISRWLIMAILTGAIAGHLSGWSKEEGIMPINKHLWSLSFALLTSSLAFLTKSILFFIIDFKEWWSGTPFQQVGKNAILIYIGSELTEEAIPWNWTPIDYTNHIQVLWMNFWSTLLWIIIAVFLDMWNIYFSI